MDYECGPLLLYSQDKIRMMDFLSDVFEFDVDSLTDSIQRGPLYIKLCERPKAVMDENTPMNDQDAGIVFSFKVKSEQELKEIMSKYNFFLYRKATPTQSSEKLDLFQSDKKKILTISDIDQRLWRFEFETRSHCGEGHDF